jgi:HD-like signal output (HDOD) protein
VLRGIERALLDRADDWELEFADSGREALELLGRAPCDVVVSDMRMPAMTGVDLLERVHALYPGTVRVILSGQSDDDSAARLAHVAHQFLGKPCSADHLCGVIERAESLQRLLSPTTIRAIAGGGALHLPPAPRVFAELSRVLQAENASVNQIAGIIARDPPLSAKLLQFANSAYFCSGSPVTDIQTAVTRIGTRPLRSLVLALELGSGSGAHRLSVPGLDVEAMRMCALRASVLARDVLGDNSAGQIAGTAALLSDLGRVVLAAGLPAVREVWTAATTTGTAFQLAELQAFGFTHATVGAYVLGLWGLPPSIFEPVAHHHTPSESTEIGFGVTGAVHLATSLASGHDPDLEYLQGRGVGDRLDAWRHAATHTWRRL